MSSCTTSANGRGSDTGRPTSSTRHHSPTNATTTASPAYIEQLRQQLASGLQAQPELRDLLDLCAESNAWSVEEARQRPDTIAFMELFLLQVHRVPLVRYFPNLVTIKFMSIGLESTADFAALTRVEELWLSENNLRVIEGLENMTKLRRLYLQGNNIASLAGLPPLRHLRELWVSRNRLTRLTHLTPLCKLRALYAGDNPIELLDGAFSKDMTHLHDVNLSGCHLADIAQLCYLQQLPCLRNVWFADPLFGENPICRMNNYTTLVLARLDTLEFLDGVYVPAEQRSLVENVLGKKKLYYAMRAQMLETHLVLLTQHAETCAAQDVAQNADALSQLHAFLQPIVAELEERQLYLSSSGSGAAEEAVSGEGGSLTIGPDGRLHAAGAVLESAKLEATRLQLARSVSTCELYEQTTLLRLAEATNATAMQAQLLRERLAVELHTAGNVRLEQVSPQHEYFTSIDTLLQERFEQGLFERELGITSVSVKSVRRIINRGLRMRFDNRAKEMHVNMANPQHCSRMVGLFGIVPRTREAQSACLQHALTRGVDATEAVAAAAVSAGAPPDAARDDCAPTPADEGVPLTDSLFYADETRLRALLGDGEGSGGGVVALGSSLSQLQVCSDGRGSDGVVCHGQLVLYRTYLGKAVSALGGVRRDTTPGAFPRSYLSRAGRVLRKDYGEDVTTAYRFLPAETDSSSSGGGDAGGVGRGGAGSTTEASTRPRPSTVWYCFDRALILADCVVDYCYTVRPTSPAHTAFPSTLRGAALPQPDPSAVTALLSAVCPPCGSVGGGSTARERGTTAAAAAADTGRDVREDLLSCAAPLFEFINWCGGMTSSTHHSNTAPRDKARRPSTGVVQGNTLKVVAAKEAAEAVASAAAVLGATVAGHLLRRPAHASLNTVTAPQSSKKQATTATTGATAKTSISNPLQARDVEAYASSLHISDGALTLCVLRGLGLTAVWKDLSCALLAAVTTLDLSLNAITDFSWFALAKEAPLLRRLNLRGNRLTAFTLDGSRLPELRVLDVSDNQLTCVHDFRTIRVAAPALEELEVRGNPCLTLARRQEAEAQLWLYLAPPDRIGNSTTAATAVRLNQRTLGAYPGTLAAQRYHRASLFPGGHHASAHTMRLAEHLLLRLVETNSAAGAAATAALLSMDGVSVPERYVSAAEAELERWAASGTVVEGLAAAARGRQSASSERAHMDAVAAPAAACLSECQDFSWRYGLLEDMRWLAVLLPNLRRVVLRGNALTSVDPLLQLTRLESLDVSENHIATLPCLSGLKALRELVVDFNALTVLPRRVGPLPQLRLLSASGNNISRVDASLFLAPSAGDGGGTGSATSPPPATVPQLETLHLTRNAIADMNVVYALREITSLLILSVMGNPCTLPDLAQVQRTEADAARGAAPEDTRQYLIHVFPQLKVLDGCAISAAEGARARGVYAGRINTDLLMEKARGPPDTWTAVRNLNLSHCTLTEVRLLEPFVGLELLQLQHNLITSVSGLSTLTRLRALDLSHNRVGMAAWRSVNHVSTALTTSSLSNGNGAAAAVGGGGASSAASLASAYVALGDALAPLKQLESLSIEANQITDLSVLKLRLPRLKFLNARGNELQFPQRGLEHLPDLRELLLDHNKLRGLSAEFLAGNKKLSILSAENNALRTLDGLRGCTRLEQLHLGANRLGELKSALYELQACPLKVLVLVGNPLARKSNYRNTVITYFTQLTDLDRRAISAEEREKAAAARVTEYVAPPNVVIDMDFLGAAGMSTAGSPVGVALPLSGVGLSGNMGVGVGLPSRNRISNPSAAIPAGMRRAVNGNGGGAGSPRGGGLGGIGGVSGTTANATPAADRFQVNPRTRNYRR